MINEDNNTITEKTTIFSYLIYILKILIKQSSIKIETSVPNTVNCIIEDVNGYEDWINIIGSKESREKLIKKGENAGYLFKQYTALLSMRFFWGGGPRLRLKCHSFFIRCHKLKRC